MSRFYGSLQGNRGMATRCGTKDSGISAHVRGWDIGVYAEVRPCGKCGGDRVYASLSGGSHGSPVPPGPGYSFTYCPYCEGERE